MYIAHEKGSLAISSPAFFFFVILMVSSYLVDAVFKMVDLPRAEIFLSLRRHVSTVKSESLIIQFFTSIVNYFMSPSRALSVLFVLLNSPLILHFVCCFLTLFCAARLHTHAIQRHVTNINFRASLLELADEASPRLPLPGIPR